MKLIDELSKLLAKHGDIKCVDLEFKLPLNTLVVKKLSTYENEEVLIIGVDQ